MKPYGTAISTVVLEKDQGAGDSTPSNNDIQNGTEVPAPDGDSNKSRGNKKGAGVLTPSNNDIQHGTKVPAPDGDSNKSRGNKKGAGISTPLKQSEDGTEVPAPSYDSAETKVPTPRKFLPHIDMLEYYQFVTFRTHDSLDEFVKKMRRTDMPNRKKEHEIDQYLDQSSNGAYLNGDALKYLYRYLIDQDKILYDLVAFTIMPNHVHILFKQKSSLPTIMKRIKGATAFAINKILDKKGRFWEENYYDRLIRDDSHFAKIYDYIKYNAVKANLKNAEERFYSIYE